jgi:hypothetical protein
VGVLISGVFFATANESAMRPTVTKTSVSTVVETRMCPDVTGIIGTAPVPPLAWVYTNATSGISDLWNATVTGYSGSAEVFSQCFMGINVGEMYINNDPALTYKVTAQKMDAGHDNLTLRVDGLQKSTNAPFGFVSIFTSPKP